MGWILREWGRLSRQRRGSPIVRCRGRPGCRASPQFSRRRCGDGLGAGRVNSFLVDRAGTLWTAAEGGLSRLRNGRFSNLTSRNGLPCDAVHWAIEDDAHSMWLAMPCGLIRISRTELDAWTAAEDLQNDPTRT